MIILKSKKLKKVILPRLSNAHFYPLNALPIYHFLCEIQNQFTKRSLFFEWPDLGYEPTFLPRLTVSNVIISPASWNIDKELLSTLINNVSNYENLKKFKVPQHVVYAEGDNTLVIDLMNPNAVRMLLNSSKNKDIILLKEYLPPTKLIQDNRECFSHQLIIPLIRNEKNDDLTILNSIITDEEDNKPQKSFYPGSEWLYFKIYGGKQGIERILAYELSYLLDELHKNKLIEKWFFIRYADPEYHLRLRFKLYDNKNIGHVLELVHSYIQNWIDKKLAHKIAIDTYHRELERYLYSSIEDIESLFHHDSDSITKYLHIVNEESDRLRWMFGLKSIDYLLNDFGFDLDQKLKFLENPSKYFQREFNVDKKILQKINQKFKKHKEELLVYLNSDIQSDIILNNRTAATKKIINNILTKYNHDNIDKPLYSLLGDISHMLINRLFHFNPRFHEMIIYEFLINYYKFIKNYAPTKVLFN